MRKASVAVLDLFMRRVQAREALVRIDGFLVVAAREFRVGKASSASPAYFENGKLLLHVAEVVRRLDVILFLQLFETALVVLLGGHGIVDLLAIVAGSTGDDTGRQEQGGKQQNLVGCLRHERSILLSRWPSVHGISCLS
jgi:hypothetical protein